MNFLAILTATFIPLILGFIWYNPNVFGNAWMKAAGFTNPDDLKQGANMTIIFGVSILFALLLSLSLNPMVIHQFAITSITSDLPDIKDAKVEILVDGKAIDYLHKFRTFKHGAFHGFLYGLFFVLPVLGTNALFERKGFKYIAINVC